VAALNQALAARKRYIDSQKDITIESIGTGEGLRENDKDSVACDYLQFVNISPTGFRGLQNQGEEGKEYALSIDI